MSDFTMPLKRVIELAGRNNIGLTTYPLFDEGYRVKLNDKIIDHYWNREIGLETIDMFQLAMRRKMNEIMPYYNKLYKTELIDYQALMTIDIRNTASGTSKQENENAGESVSDSTSDSNSRAVNSDTPQTFLQDDEDYATAAADVISKALANAKANETSTAKSEAEQANQSHTQGYTGPASQLIMMFRETLLNIDIMIINDTSDCFMGIWTTGDNYTDDTGWLRKAPRSVLPNLSRPKPEPVYGIYKDPANPGFAKYGIIPAGVTALTPDGNGFLS